MKRYFPPPLPLIGLVSLMALPNLAGAATVTNPLCPTEMANFAPGHGQDITVPDGFTVSVFASGLNMPTGIAFLGNANVLSLSSNACPRPAQCSWFVHRRGCSCLEEFVMVHCETAI